MGNDPQGGKRRVSAVRANRKEEPLDTWAVIKAVNEASLAKAVEYLESWNPTPEMLETIAADSEAGICRDAAQAILDEPP